ncbi:hypothetical protein ACFYOV_14505 [Streptomyces sp. NPDC005931]|uniref:hypothetical protein n=1 Tax=Streptomyces sp. NPDC005931 TaxID=3364737 RepID=UPI00369C8129
MDLTVMTRFAVSVVTAARAHGHDVLLLTQPEDGEGIARVAGAGSTDALVVTDVQLHDPRLPLLRRLPVPCVLIRVPAEPEGPEAGDLLEGGGGGAGREEQDGEESAQEGDRDGAAQCGSGLLHGNGR